MYKLNTGLKYGTLLLALAALFLSCDYRTERMAGYSVHGVDVSRHQGRIDWAQVADDGIRFAYVKASEGEDWQDSTFCYNWDEVRANGIRRGAYHFFRPARSALEQANNFINTVNELREGDLPPALDAETTDGASKEVIVNRIRSWLEIVEMHYHIRPVIYTNLKFYYKYIVGNFDQYPIWISRYSYASPQLIGNQWTFWQYSREGRVRGIGTEVDLNVFNGDSTVLEAISYHPPNVLSLR